MINPYTVAAYPQRKWTHLWDEVARGRHSNIPRCCIRFFIERWIRPESDFGMTTREQNNYSRRVMRRRFAGNYVPCPRCLVAGHSARIHRCGKRCGNYCSRVQIKAAISSY